MQKIVGSMESVMKSMDVEKISAVMDKFEQQFEDLDLNSQYMESAIDSTTAQTMPESQVDGLMAQVTHDTTHTDTATRSKVYSRFCVFDFETCCGVTLLFLFFCVECRSQTSTA